MPLSAAAEAALNAEESEEVWLFLLTIEHDNLAEPIRVVRNTENVYSRGNLFVGLPFEIELPGADGERPASARIKIDNVDRVIVNTIRSIQTPPRVTFEAVLASSPDTIEVQFANLILKNVSYDALAVEGELSWEEIVTEAIAEAITPARFPGLF